MHLPNIDWQPVAVLDTNPVEVVMSLVPEGVMDDCELAVGEAIVVLDIKDVDDDG